MTPMEILARIVEAESNARSVFDEATDLQEDFDNYVNEHIAVLREQYFGRADAAIAEAKEREAARAESEMAALDSKRAEELAALRSFYEKERESIVTRLFKLAVAIDA